MRKMRWGLLFVLLLIAVPAFYVFGGLQGAETRADYTLEMARPETGQVTVTLTITPSARPFVHLFLRDAVQEGTARVADLQVTRDGAAPAHWLTFPGSNDLQTVWTGFSRAPLRITYRLDALWMKGPESPRSYLGADFGYLRGMVTLYTPLSGADMLRLLRNADSHGDSTGQARLHFLLPAGWTAVSPWGDTQSEIPITELRNVYFGFGPFATQTVPGAPCTLSLNVFTGLGDGEYARLLEMLPGLFKAQQECTGIPVASYAPACTLTILPTEPIHGGAAGTNSLIVENTLEIVSHELFHWWNGTTIETSTEANWIKEGFTVYYAGKTLHQAEIWSAAELEEYADKFYYKAGADDAPAPFSLIEASQKLRSEGGKLNYNRVYFGGAWVARWLDQRLQAQGKSLDAVWPALKAREAVVTPEIFFEEVARLGGDALAQECREYVEGRRALAP